MNRFSRFVIPLLTAAVLLLQFSLGISSMAGDAPTFDEQGFLVRGLAYLRDEADGGKRDIRVGHPLGLNALNAMLLVDDPTVSLPTSDPSWQETSFHRPAELFLWEIGNDVAHVMFLARVPTVWLWLLLAAVGARWAAEIARGRRHLAGLLALFLLAFDPNLMAHARLVTTDLGLAAGAGLAGFALWRFLRHPTWFAAAFAGGALGLMLNTKFTALLFLPLFGVVILLRLLQLRRMGDNRGAGRVLLLSVSLYPLAALLVLWAGHGFQTGELNAPLPLLGDLGGVPVPLSSYLDQLLDIGGRLSVATPSFLLGQYSDSGWWYYFPVAFLVKTPLPVLLLLGVAVGWLLFLFWRRRELIGGMWFDMAALLVPALGFFAVALMTDINLGYRHLLPILPFLYVFTAAVVAKMSATAGASAHRLVNGAALIAAGWLVVVSLWIYPHYLAFFNILAGGPDGGWRVLVDSNLDWGQDLGRLSGWLADNGAEPVWLSYFGEARPSYYGIDYVGLDSFPPRLMNPNARPFYPHDPAPGWYAISATTLQGVHFANHDQFDYFRRRTPADKIGYSIFLYEQPAHGPAVDLLLGGVQVDELAPEHFAQLGTNDVTLRWFNPDEALILPDGARPVWLAVGATPLHPRLAAYLSLAPAAEPTRGDGYSLQQVTPVLPSVTVEAFALSHNDGQITFNGAPVIETENGTLNIVTLWQQTGRPQPVKIFIHVLDGNGEIAAQWDGLSAEWEGWRPGDTLIQRHELPLNGLSLGDYRITVGLYNPEKMERWYTAEGLDVIELGQVSVEGE